MPTALRAITRFKCIGPECEDTCCARLQVTVTRQELERLEAAAGPSVRSGFEPLAGTNDLVIRKDADRQCTFLTQEKWCSLHARVGEAPLPDICAMFPRIARGQGEDRIALGSLACPEYARLALLTDDGVDEVPLLESLPIRENLVRFSFQRSKEVAYPWFAPTVLPALAQPWRTQEMAAAMEQVLAIGARLTPFFFHGTDAFSEGRWDDAEARLRSALSGDSGSAEVGVDEGGSARAAGVNRVLRLLARRVANGGPERMEEVFGPALERWGAGARTPEILDELDAVGRGLAESGAIGRAFRNFAVAFTYMSHYALHFDVLTFAQHLALRLACARVLLFGKVAQHWPADASREEQERWLDAALVQVFQVLTKYLDQDPTTFHEGLELSSGSLEERCARGRELSALLGPAH